MPQAVARSSALVLLLAASCAAPAGGRAAEHAIEPGAPPQPVLDAARPGDRIVFLPGLHQHPPGRHRSILYVDKPVHVELRTGAVLRLADGSCPPGTTGEITVDQDAQAGKLDDLEVGGEFTRRDRGGDAAELYGATV